jgi:hypothetical protein
MVVIAKKLSPAVENSNSSSNENSKVSNTNVASTGNDPASTSDEMIEVKHKKILPTKEADLKTTSEKALVKWKAKPTLTLEWTKVADFEPIVTKYGTMVSATLIAKGQKKSYGNELKAVTIKIKEGEKEVKVYLRKKFKKDNDIAQYERYGIQKFGKRYKLPSDQDELVLALPLMLASVKADGFDKEEYGEAFWTSVIADFNAIMKKISTVGGGNTVDVAAKAQLRLQIEKHLRAFIYLVRSNYPDTWEAELRAWGFEKVRS